MRDTDIRSRLRLATALAVLVCLTTALVWGSSALAQSGGGYDLTWNSVDGGGGGGSGGAYAMSGTIGQADAGVLSGGSFALRAGLWFGYIPAPGDCNNDAGVNAGDISAVILEIFDADGTAPDQAPGSSFVGDPDGCNPNSDGAINAGDISCLILLIFNGPGSC